MTGYVPRERLRDLYRHARAFVYPSRYEGFPNALAEAMAAGLPAVAFANVSGVEDLISHGETGILAHGDYVGHDNAVRALTGEG